MKPRHLMLLALPLLVAIAVPLFMVVAEIPTYGEVNQTFNYVVERYNAEALRETGATNVVTGIILDYRAYDTMIETTVLGAAYLAGLAVGLWPDAGSLAKLRRTDLKFKPKMKPETREALYQGWKQAVARVRSR